MSKKSLSYVSFIICVCLAFSPAWAETFGASGSGKLSSIDPIDDSLGISKSCDINKPPPPHTNCAVPDGNGGYNCIQTDWDSCGYCCGQQVGGAMYRMGGSEDWTHDCESEC